MSRKPGGGCTGLGPFGASPNGSVHDRTVEIAFGQDRGVRPAGAVAVEEIEEHVVAIVDEIGQRRGGAMRYRKRDAAIKRVVSEIDLLRHVVAAVLLDHARKPIA